MRALRALRANVRCGNGCWSVGLDSANRPQTHPAAAPAARRTVRVPSSQRGLAYQTQRSVPRGSGSVIAIRASAQAVSKGVSAAVGRGYRSRDRPDRQTRDLPTPPSLTQLRAPAANLVWKSSNAALAKYARRGRHRAHPSCVATTPANQRPAARAPARVSSASAEDYSRAVAKDRWRRRRHQAPGNDDDDLAADLPSLRIDGLGRKVTSSLVGDLLRRRTDAQPPRIVDEVWQPNHR